MQKLAQEPACRLRISSRGGFAEGESALGLPPEQPSDDGAESLRGERSVHRTDENDLLIAHEELSARLLERNPVPRVPTISAEEQLELLFHGVALLDGYRVILSVQQRDLEIHAPSLRIPPEQRSDD